MSALGNAALSVAKKLGKPKGAAKPKKATGGADATTAGTSSMPGIDPGANAADIEAGTGSIRDGVKTITTMLGAVATAIVGTVGFTRADDIFPMPSNAPGWLGAVTALFAGAALFATGFLIVRLYVVQQRIMIGSALNGFAWWERFDAERIRRLASIHVMELGEDSLHAMDLRSNRLVRIANRLDPLGSTARDAKLAANATKDQRLALKARHEAIRLNDVVRLELLGLGANLLEQRARRAFGGPTTYVLLLVAILGVAWTFGVGDWAKGQRGKQPAPATTTTVITQSPTGTTTTKTIKGG